MEQIKSEKIKEAVEKIIEKIPVYKDILLFYEKIFTAREESKNNLKIEILANIEKKNPLIKPSDFVIDIKASKELFIKNCEIMRDFQEEMSSPANKILNALKNNNINIEAILSNFLKNGLEPQIANLLDIKADILNIIILNSIKPSLELYAEKISYLVDKDYRDGKCPVCGGFPCFAILNENGERFFICEFCGYEWLSQRIYCPFCDNKDPESLFYSYDEDDKSYRIDRCKKCGKYVKTADAKAMNRIVYPPLEKIATMHLDAAMKK